MEAISAIVGLVSMLLSTVFGGYSQVSAMRQMNQSQVAAVRQCPPNTRPQFVTDANGASQLVCVENPR